MTRLLKKSLIIASILKEKEKGPNYHLPGSIKLSEKLFRMICSFFKIKSSEYSHLLDKSGPIPKSLSLLPSCRLLQALMIVWPTVTFPALKKDFH